MPDEVLPWERAGGDPLGTGICLSGGGLRAASYAMGVLQSLQERQGLLFGPTAADHLAAVSGGAYTAAAALLSAEESTTACPPLAAVSPEADHIVSHGRYLVEDGLGGLWRFAWRLPVSALASVLLFTWTGYMLADIAVLVDRYLPVPVLPGVWSWAGFGVLLASTVLLGISQQTDRLSRATEMAVAGEFGVVLFAPTLLTRLHGSEWLARPLWWAERWPAVLAFLLLYIVASVLPYLIPGLGRTLAEGFTRNGLRAAVVLVSCWSAAAMEPHFKTILDADTPSAWYFLLVFGPLVGGLWASYVHDVVSLHRPYRSLLARCFGVRRQADGGGCPRNTRDRRPTLRTHPGIGPRSAAASPADLCNGEPAR